MRKVALLALAACAPASPTPSTTAVVVSSSPLPSELVVPVAPRPAPPPVARRTLALDYFARCLVDDGALYCWATEDAQGATAPLTRNVKPVPIGARVTSIDVGNRHACAVTDEGAVHCWGNNRFGNLGAGLPEESSATPRRVLDLDDALAVAVGPWHSCAVRRGGKVSCWGDNRYGQAGHDTVHAPAARRLVRPVEIAGLEQVTAISAGETHTCALTAEGIVWCWGQPFGPGAPRSYESRPEPRALEPLARATQLATGDDLGCVILAAGGVQCWNRYNSYGELGHPGSEDAPVVGISRPRLMAVGDHHACALDDVIRCWGLRRGGRLGSGRLARPGRRPARGRGREVGPPPLHQHSSPGWDQSGFVVRGARIAGGWKFCLLTVCVAVGDVLT